MGCNRDMTTTGPGCPQLAICLISPSYISLLGHRHTCEPQARAVLPVAREQEADFWELSPWERWEAAT